MNMTNAKDWWFSRNDWAMPIIGSVILVLTQWVASTLPEDSGVRLPAWASVLASVFSLLGLFIGAVKAQVSTSLSARSFCHVVVVFGCVVAILQLVEAIKH